MTPDDTQVSADHVAYVRPIQSLDPAVGQEPIKFILGGGPRVVVSTAAFHARVRVKVSIVGSPRDREVACSASDRQGSNFESCVISIILPASGGSSGPV